MALTKVSGPLLNSGNHNLGNYVINNITGAAATFTSLDCSNIDLSADDLKIVGIITNSVLTPERVVWVGTGNTLTESDNLTWDNTNVRLKNLGITSTKDLNVTGVSTLTELLVQGGSAAKPTFRHSAGWGALRVAGSAGGSGAGFIFANNYSGTIEEKWSIYLDGSTDDLRFTAGPPETTASERLRIASDGKVGILTTSPQVALHVFDGGSGLRLERKGTNIGYYNVAISHGTPVGANNYGSVYFTLSQTTGDYVWKSSSNERMRLLGDSGRLGIGLDAPAEALDVSGTIQTTTGLKVAGHPVVGYASYKIGAGDYVTRLGSTGTSTLRSTQIYAGGGHQATFDGANGRVGLGVTNPDLRLHVNGTNAVPATSGSSPAGHLCLRNKAGNSSHGMFMGVSNAAPWGSWIQAQDANALGTEYPLAINPNGGNVGINSMKPSTEFEVLGGGTVAKFRGTGGNGFIAIEDVDAATGLVFLGNDDAKFQVQTSGSSYSTKFEVNTVGGVVINGAVVDPDVSGGAFTGGVYIKANDAATVGSGAGIRFGGSSGSKESYGTISALHTSGNNGDMAFNMYEGGSDHPEKMRLTSAGRLLLGGTESTISNAKLQVFGTSNTNNIVITNTSASDSSGNRYSKIKFRGTQSGGEVSTLASIVAHHEGSSDDEAGSLLFKTNDGDDGDGPSENMRIYADGHITMFGSGPWSDPGVTDFRMFNGNFDLADDSSVSFTSAANTGALVCVGSFKRSGGSITYASALFFVTYGSTTVTKISDPRGIFSNSDSDGLVCVLKTTSTGGTFSVKNRIGVTNKISVNIIGLQGL